MAVATNWFDSHSFFLCVFIFKSTALKLYKRRDPFFYTASVSSSATVIF